MGTFFASLAVQMSKNDRKKSGKFSTVWPFCLHKGNQLEMQIFF